MGDNNILCNKTNLMLKVINELCKHSEISFINLGRKACIYIFSSHVAVAKGLSSVFCLFLIYHVGILV